MTASVVLFRASFDGAVVRGRDLFSRSPLCLNSPQSRDFGFHRNDGGYVIFAGGGAI